MYIEASRPRAPGDKARLLSPLFNVTSVKGPKGSGRVPYCVSFYYHMKGKHIGEDTPTHTHTHTHVETTFTCSFSRGRTLFSDDLHSINQQQDDLRAQTHADTEVTAVAVSVQVSLVYFAACVWVCKKRKVVCPPVPRVTRLLTKPKSQI